MRAQFAIAIMFLVIAVPASAQQSQCTRGPARVSSPQITAARQQMHSACAADIAAFCASRPACTGLARCLDANDPRLSSACSGALAQLKAAHREITQN